jgi:hypothetical protein
MPCQPRRAFRLWRIIRLMRHTPPARDWVGSLTVPKAVPNRVARFTVKIPLAPGTIPKSIECKPMKSIASW